VKRRQKQYLICRICGEPLQLGPGTVTDENGQSVHESCQVKHIITTQRYKNRLHAVLPEDLPHDCEAGKSF